MAETRLSGRFWRLFSVQRDPSYGVASLSLNQSLAACCRVTQSLAENIFSPDKGLAEAAARFTHSLAESRRFLRSNGSLELAPPARIVDLTRHWTRPIVSVTVILIVWLSRTAGHNRRLLSDRVAPQRVNRNRSLEKEALCARS